MNDLDALYQDVVLEHKRRPRHYGPLPAANRQAEGHNPLCGDTVTLRLREADGRIEDVAFEGQGCAICVASASMLTEAVHGCTLAQARCKMQAAQRMLTGDGAADEDSLGKLIVLSGVRRFPSRIKCAALAWHALGHCLADRETGPGGGTAGQSRMGGDRGAGHAHGGHGDEGHTHGSHAHGDRFHDGQAQDGHASERHAHEGHAHEGHGNQGHGDEGHTHEGHTHEGHRREGHMHVGHMHEAHAREAHARDDRGQRIGRDAGAQGSVFQERAAAIAAVPQGFRHAPGRA